MTRRVAGYITSRSVIVGPARDAGYAEQIVPAWGISMQLDARRLGARLGDRGPQCPILRITYAPSVHQKAQIQGP